MQSVSSFTLRSFICLLGCGLLVTPRAIAADDSEALVINVRTFVERPFSLFGKKPAIEHSKLYSMTTIKCSNDLWKDRSNPPSGAVNESQLGEQLAHELAVLGYRRAINDVPDIVISAYYGRGNPYAGKTFATETGEMGLPTGASAEKTSRTADDRLFVIVSAWEFPGFDPHAKKKLLWRTAISVDQPDQNLNQIAARLFAASGSYFDHETPNGEVTVTSNPSEGKTSMSQSSEPALDKAVK